MNRLCNSKIVCDDPNNPLTSFSSEDPEKEFALAMQTQNFMPPPLGSNFTTSNCFSIAVGTNTEEALGLALSDVVDCIAAHGKTPPTYELPDPPGVPPFDVDPNVFVNGEQTCTTLCPDGLPFTYVVAAGRFSGFNQDQVDEMARTYACSKVVLARICISNITQPECCLGTQTAINFTADGNGVFHVQSGAPPTGLTLQQTSPSTAVLAGVPTAIGNFTFTMRITDTNGDYMDKTFQIRTVGIITSSLPGVQALVAYSATIVGSGNTFGTVTWSIIGSLPPGLSFDASTQTISGTPTDGGTYPFVVQMADGIIACQKQFSIVVTPCVAFNPALAGALHWWDASQLSYTNGQQVNPWSNLIGVGNTPWGGAASPNYPFFMTGILNGLPVVRWTAANPGRRVFTARNAGNSADIFNFCSGLSCMDVFVVGSDTGGSTGRTMIESAFITPGSGGFRLVYNGASAPFGQFQVDFKRTNASVTQITKKGAYTPTTGQYDIFHVKLFWANATIDININGTNLLLNDPTGETTGTSEHNTNSFFPDDTDTTQDIAEVIIFSNNLSQSDIDKAFGYLAYKWGLRSKLPSNHPYKDSIPCA